MTTKAGPEAVIPEAELLPPEHQATAEQLRQKALETISATEKFIVEIKDADTYAQAVDYAKKLDREITELKKEREGICAPLFQAHRRATSFFNRLLEWREERKRAIEKATAAYRVEQQRRIDEENARLAAIERRKKELNDAHDAALREDGERLQAFLRAWDAAINEDEDRRRAAERKREEDARIKTAEAAQQGGAKAETVEHILATPTPLAPPPVVLTAPVVSEAPKPLPPPPPPPAPVAPPPPPPPLTEIPPATVPAAFVPDIKGVQKKTNWKFKVTSPRRFLQALLDDRIPGVTIAGSVTINDGARGEIGTQVARLKGACVDEFAKYGVEVWPEADDTIKDTTK